jgi:hypothetical protein
VVTGLHGRDPRSHLNHDTGTFVTANDGEGVGHPGHLANFLGWNRVAGHEMLIGMTQAGGRHLDENFPGPGWL